MFPLGAIGQKTNGLWHPAHSSTSARTLINHDQLRQDIHSASTMDDCLNIWRNPSFQTSMDVIRESREAFMNHNGYGKTETKQIEEWAKGWAQALADGEIWAIDLDNCRRTASRLLQKTCDHWDSGSDINDFGTDKVHLLMKDALVLDRANALYQMQPIKGGVERGLNWYSRYDTAIMKQLNMPKNPVSATINRRYIWLFHHVFAGDKQFENWLIPQFAPGKASNAAKVSALSVLQARSEVMTKEGDTFGGKRKHSSITTFSSNQAIKTSKPISRQAMAKLNPHRPHQRGLFPYNPVYAKAMGPRYVDPQLVAPGRPLSDKFENRQAENLIHQLLPLVHSAIDQHHLNLRDYMPARLPIKEYKGTRRWEHWTKAEVIQKMHRYGGFSAYHHVHGPGFYLAKSKADADNMYAGDLEDRLVLQFNENNKLLDITDYNPNVEGNPFYNRFKENAQYGSLHEAITNTFMAFQEEQRSRYDRHLAGSDQSPYFKYWDDYSIDYQFLNEIKKLTTDLFLTTLIEKAGFQGYVYNTGKNVRDWNQRYQTREGVILFNGSQIVPYVIPELMAKDVPWVLCPSAVGNVHQKNREIDLKMSLKELYPLALWESIDYERIQDEINNRGTPKYLETNYIRVPQADYPLFNEFMTEYGNLAKEKHSNTPIFEALQWFRGLTRKRHPKEVKNHNDLIGFKKPKMLLRADKNGGLTEAHRHDQSTGCFEFHKGNDYDEISDSFGYQQFEELVLLYQQYRQQKLQSPHFKLTSQNMSRLLARAPQAHIYQNFEECSYPMPVDFC